LRDNKNIYFIGETASIHEGSYSYLIKLINKVVKTEISAIKFQPYLADELVSKDHPDYKFFKNSEINEIQWKQIFTLVNNKKKDVWIDIFSEFSKYLCLTYSKKIKGIKINLSLLDDLKIIEFINNFNHPVIIPTSGSNLLTIIEFVKKLNPSIDCILMHGYQSFPKIFTKGGPPKYPITIEDLELWKIQYLKNIFPNFTIGLSEHLKFDSKDINLANSIAFALGAKYFERHIQIDHKEKREDYFSSSNIKDVNNIIRYLNKTNKIIGEDRRIKNKKEKKYNSEMRKALRAKNLTNLDKKIEFEDIVSARTGNYKSSSKPINIIGKNFNKNLKKNSIINDSDINYSIGIFCNVRTDSKRLKNKALLNIYKNKTCIEYLIQRLKIYLNKHKLQYKLVVCTTNRRVDDKISNIVKKNKIDCFRGANEDVMKRMIDMAKLHKLDHVIRVTGDDILVSPDHFKDAVDYHLKKNSDYTLIKGLPIGMSFEIIRINAVKTIHKIIKNKVYTEYITYFLDSENVLNLETFYINKYKKFNISQYSLTLDNYVDYENLSKIINKLHKKYKSKFLSTKNIISNLKIIQKNTYKVKKSRKQIDTSLLFN